MLLQKCDLGRLPITGKGHNSYYFRCVTKKVTNDKKRHIAHVIANV